MEAAFAINCQLGAKVVSFLSKVPSCIHIQKKQIWSFNSAFLVTGSSGSSSNLY